MLAPVLFDQPVDPYDPVLEAAGGVAEVDKDNWLKTEDAVTTGLYATCLKCGYQARDNYNWDRLNS